MDRNLKKFGLYVFKLYCCVCLNISCGLLFLQDLQEFTSYILPLGVIHRSILCMKSVISYNFSTVLTKKDRKIPMTLFL